MFVCLRLSSTCVQYPTTQNNQFRIHRAEGSGFLAIGRCCAMYFMVVSVLMFCRNIVCAQQLNHVRFRDTREDGFLGYAKDNPPGVPSPNEFGWLQIDLRHTPEGRAALRRQAVERKRRALEKAARRKRDELERRRVELERIALQKRQEILDALRIKVGQIKKFR